jgi:hypothetical protein
MDFVSGFLAGLRYQEWGERRPAASATYKDREW